VGGAKTRAELEGLERELTIAGFLVPERRAFSNESNEEFVLYNWVDSEVRYGVVNALMAQYYKDKLAISRNLKCGLMEGMDRPTSCIDLLVRSLPFMSFAAEVEIPTKVANGMALTLEPRPLSSTNARSYRPRRRPSSMASSKNYAAPSHVDQDFLVFYSPIEH
jgi:hypothetical protein